MTHDAEHLSGHHAARRAAIARPRPGELSLSQPGHAGRFSEIEFLRRASRHIRLRMHDERTAVADGTVDRPAPESGAANDAVSGSPGDDAAR